MFRFFLAGIDIVCLICAVIMKAETLQILWHDKEPIYTCDSNGSILATAGTDSVIRVSLPLLQSCAHHTYSYSHHMPTASFNFVKALLEANDEAFTTLSCLSPE